MNPIDLNEEISVPEELEPTPTPKAAKKNAKAAPAPVEEVEVEEVAPVAAPVEDLGDLRVVNRGSLSEKAIRMRSHLAALPKITLFIPLQGGEKAGSLYEGGLNGLRFEVLKGKQVSIPTQIAENIFDSLRISHELGANHPANMRNVGDDVKAALS